MKDIKDIKTFALAIRILGFLGCIIIAAINFYVPHIICGIALIFALVFLFGKFTITVNGKKID